jgi:hypothetical protein
MKKRRPIFAPGWMSMPGLLVRVLGHHARQDQRAELVELVRDPVHRDRADRGIRRDDLAVAARGRVGAEGGVDVLVEPRADLGQPRQERLDDRLLLAVARRADRIEQRESRCAERRDLGAQRRALALDEHERLQRSTHSATSAGLGQPLVRACASAVSSPPARPETVRSSTSGSIVGSADMRRTEGFPTEGS